MARKLTGSQQGDLLALGSETRNGSAAQHVCVCVHVCVHVPTRAHLEGGGMCAMRGQEAAAPGTFQLQTGGP